MHPFLVKSLLLRDEDLAKWGKLSSTCSIVLGLLLILFAVGFHFFGNHLIEMMFEENLQLTERTLGEIVIEDPKELAGSIISSRREIGNIAADLFSVFPILFGAFGFVSIGYGVICLRAAELVAQKRELERKIEALLPNH